MNDEDRLERLPMDARHRGAFVEATERFLREFGLEALLVEGGTQAPQVAPDRSHNFKYDGYYTDSAEELQRGDELLIAVVMKGSLLIGFGVAEIGAEQDGSWEIKIIDVDKEFRRHRGVETSLVLGEQQFTVGVAHAIVHTLLSALPRQVSADATSPGSRYAFKAFGFEHREGTRNPCLIVLK